MAIERRERFGEYLLLGWIGAGATAKVYRARREGDDRIVALKIMRDAYAATPAELRRFRAGAAAAATLDHPHIVAVVDYGERGEEPFVAMDLIEGENLQDVLGREPREHGQAPEAAARLMRAIAEAVAHAHDRGVVHRDLKPANILIDRAGVPHVADFGLAKRVAPEASFNASVGPGAIVGAPAYMAPEIIDGDGGGTGATTLPLAADVFSLGVIFYQLLTGHLPFAGRSLDELFEQIRTLDPIPPREVNRTIAPALQNVCRKCLAKAPSERYGSARALADDLASALARRPTVAHGPTLIERARRAVRRHPRIGAGLVAAAVTALIAGAAATKVWRDEARERARTLQMNGFIASGQAGAMLFQLRAYADRVERAARQPLVRALLEAGTIVDPAPQLVPLADGFDGVYLESMQGQVLAQWPSPVPYVFERRYTFRDYFRGARLLGETGADGVYVARAYRSESHGVMQFAISTPVFDGAGRQIGILVAALHAKEAFGAIRMQAAATGQAAAGEGRITTALIGPRGSDRGDAPDSPTPSRYTFLVHPGLKTGAEHTLETPSPARLLDKFGPPAGPGHQLSLEYVPPLEAPDYRDPIPGFEGRWVAAFAPVGRTGFVVLAETPRPDAVRWFVALLPTMTVSIMGVLGLLAAASLVTWQRRRRRTPRAVARSPRSAARTR